MNPPAQRYESGMRERNWDDNNDEDERYDTDTAYYGHRISPVASNTTNRPMAMQDSHTPMLAPGLYHSHSSNRARGRRISHSSLQSVAEMREPEHDEPAAAAAAAAVGNAESPVLGRYYQHKRGLAANKREGKSVAHSPSIRRKPVGVQSPFEGYGATSWGEGERAMHTPSRPGLAPLLPTAQYGGSGSSSSGLAASSHSSLSSYAYVEDYGPEYYYGGGAYNGGYEEAHIGRGF